MVHYHTFGEHFDPFPSPNGAAPHARGTFLPLSVAQRCITARPGNSSTRFRSPRVHYRTLGRHLRPFPSPNGAAAHARATLTPNSVAQGCRAARPGNISATIRRPIVHYHTFGRHLRPIPSPKGAAPHARATFLPRSVAQGCRAARLGDTYARFRRRGGRGKGNGRGGRSMGDGREAGLGRGQEKARARGRERAQIE